MRRVKYSNHSQFTNDIIFFLGALTTIMDRIFKVVLASFLNPFRGEVNNVKRHIYKWKFSEEHLQFMSIILGFPTVQTWTSFKYIGMPIYL
jgi:hypothetical protein